MHKRVLLALLLALTLILSGCALVVKDPEVDAATEIIRLGTDVYTKSQVLQQVDQELYNNYYNSYLMNMYGLSNSLYDPYSAANIAAAKDTVVDNLTREMVQLQRARTLGLDVMTAEEEAEIASDTDLHWNQLLSEAQSQLFAGTTLTGEELDAAVLASVTDLGYSYESYAEEARKEKLLAKLRADTLKEMPPVTEEQLQDELNQRAESAKSSYETSPAAYGNAVLNGTTVYYRPAGYRMVQQILIPFEENDSASMTDLEALADAAEEKITSLNTELENLASGTDLGATPADLDEAQQAALASITDLQEQLTAAQAELDSINAQLQEVTDRAFANLDAEADDVLARIAAGEDFETLARELSGDKDDDGEINNPEGYPVSAAMTRYDAAFQEAAMALSEAGEVSGKVRGVYGYYILKYKEDVQEGPVTLDEVRETITQTVTTNAENAFYNETVTKWVSESGVSVNRKALDD